jgi:replicative DNA helicase
MTADINEFPITQTLGMEMQVLTDIIAQPDTIIEAQRILRDDMFSDPKCCDAWKALKAMAKDGMTIDLASSYSRIDRDLMQKGILPLMNTTGGMATAVQHFAILKDAYIRRMGELGAIRILMQSRSNPSMSGADLTQQISLLTDSLRKETETGREIQHISETINDLGERIEKTIRDRAEGKVLRVPTGFSVLDYLTYGGFNAGNLVILAARPSAGKTAVMLQMAKAASFAGKSVTLLNLEMTNVELVQRFVFSTGLITPTQMAKGEVEWSRFESAAGQFTSKPIYLSDSCFSEDEIISLITMNSQAGKCDIAFIDYLGLIRFANTKAQPYVAIADCTKRLKQLAKSCNIPIVLLCQLNRASVSEKRPPAMHDLRDSGSIEQDADIILMLERAGTENDDDGRDVNMWVRKNRQGKAGEVKIEIVGNETFTVFSEKNGRDNVPPPVQLSDFDGRDEFNNDPF